MLEKWCNNHLLLLVALTAASAAGFAKAQVEPREQTTALFSKLSEVFKSSGVATLKLQAQCCNTTPLLQHHDVVVAI